MPRYRLTVEYDGGPFSGWQRQDGLPSVQACLEEAAARLDGAPVAVSAAGRTDAGVHALGQVVHLDLARARAADVVRDALNFHLKPHPVSVTAAAEAPPGFHARFDAVGRRYRYRILNRPGPPTLTRDHVWHVRRPLDADAMRDGAAHLLGTHDFTSFRAAECQAKSPVKTLDRLQIEQAGDEIQFFFAARSFLHNQVRITVGTLKLLGEGRWTQADVLRALDARDRRAAGPTAPPQGLTLMGVDYPPEPV